MASNLTTKEVLEILGISKQELVGLMLEKKLDTVLPGEFLYEDIMRLKESKHIQQVDRKNSLSELTRLSEEHGYE